MTLHADRLREAFLTHENETPDPALVYARVEELARKRRWRRRSAQAAGGAVLSAGLIAGIANLPAILPAGPQQLPVAGLPAAAPPDASAVPSADPSAGAPLEVEKELLERWDAFFNAGYSYNEAVELAKLWKMSPENIGAVKAEAGRRLLAGETLPVEAKPDPDVTEAPTPDPETTKRLDAYFAAGYDWDDAEQLAKLWKLGDPYDAKVEAGKRLLAGKKLPGVEADPQLAKEAKEGRLVGAFFEAGYDFADAEALAKLWKLDDPYAAKVAAGKKLQAGETLPIKP
ncbi:hypothetical protein AMIS_57710 [Actinoplanes missouriensis 431]|uniref:Uncharacterized protein n=1 Tax=Actinoplanes missouriensis (strain ATCC 14538 / DSM 43046 / CBS 188.64 / JCM 3121 / NBRC 102363 / NCIMB 12654 / NRRL B-3342 / UNCC 431) TaxID=512565 RepID=I0HDA4_ACTM4|nr:hypothetical protein [Actinoplanes missouriensis]BAL90991.1 hypothetical protein AMIS_57710 [Actinoplanes missouriensis 431]